MNKLKQVTRERRARKTRETIKRLGIETGIVRLTVHRSSNHIYAQILAPIGGKVLACASSLELRKEKSTEGKVGKAVQVGALLAKRALDAGLVRAACDRSGFKYHGRVAALIESARENGLNI
jgi:large subunit ribosomal protein L18